MIALRHMQSKAGASEEEVVSQFTQKILTAFESKQQDKSPLSKRVERTVSPRVNSSRSRSRCPPKERVGKSVPAALM